MVIAYDQKNLNKTTNS